MKNNENLKTINSFQRFFLKRKYGKNLEDNALSYARDKNLDGKNLENFNILNESIGCKNTEILLKNGFDLSNKSNIIEKAEEFIIDNIAGKEKIEFSNNFAIREDANVLSKLFAMEKLDLNSDTAKFASELKKLILLY